MRRRSARPFTLTNRLLALVAAIVVVTTVLVAGTEAAGVYAMAVSQAEARQIAYREILAVDIGAWLQVAGRLVRSEAANPDLRSADGAVIRRSLGAFATENAGTVSGAVVTGGTGEILASWPADDHEIVQVPAVPRSALAGGSPIIWVPPDDVAGDGGLWAVARVRGTEGATRILFLRLETDFVDSAVRRVMGVAHGSSAVVFDEAGRPVAGWTDELPTGPVAFTADDDDPTVGTVTLDGDYRYVGHYAELSALSGPEWRVAVIEPAEQAWRDTWLALRPGAIGWASALALALVVSVGVVRRATRPLRQLEVRARALASGAHVEQESVDHDDEVGRLIEAFNSVAARLDRLAAISELLARASDSSLVLEGVTSAIAHMLGKVDVDVFLLSMGDALDLVAANGRLADTESLTIAVAEVEWIAEALSSGEPVIVTPPIGDVLADLHGEGAVTALAVPLRSGDEIVGVIVVVRAGARPFSESDSETVRSFAAQASVAVQNARLFEDERRSRREAEILRSVAERVSSPFALDETLADVARAAADLLGATGSLVVLRERERFGLPASADPAEEARNASWFDEWRSALGEGAIPDAPVLVEAGASLRQRDAVRFPEGVQSALLVPLVLEEAPEGLIVLHFSHEHPTFAPRQLALAAATGKQASLALKNAYLYEQARARADNLETIFRISHAVGSSLQSRIVLNRVLDVVQKILSADAVMLLTYDTRRKVMTVPMARGVVNREMLDATFRPGEDVPGRVFETHEPERFDRLSGTDTRLLNVAHAHGLNSLLAVPLLARGRSIGVLTAFSTAESAFSTDELDLLRTFASQAALAIDTAAMYSREHHVASVLQDSILPSRLPHVPGLDTSSVYLPAAGDAEIGGDYFDLFVAPDARVVVSIGDVCGKGVEAATKTSMIKYAIRGMVAAGLGPERVLRELNGMLIETGDPAGIVTLWIGYLDVASGTLVYSDAGHPPALALDPATSRIHRLSTTGPLLGAVEDAEWSEVSFALEPGATLLLYTDGVTEARSGVRFFGEGRVRRALRKGGTAAEVSQRLLALVRRFASGELRDDAAILALVRSA